MSTPLRTQIVIMPKTEPKKLSTTQTTKDITEYFKDANIDDSNNNMKNDKLEKAVKIYNVCYEGYTHEELLCLLKL